MLRWLFCEIETSWYVDLVRGFYNKIVVSFWHFLSIAIEQMSNASLAHIVYVKK
jgi:hypothetical protein